MRLASFGVLKLTLSTRGYRWEFIRPGGAAADFGEDFCRRTWSNWCRNQPAGPARQRNVVESPNSRIELLIATTSTRCRQGSGRRRGLGMTSNHEERSTEKARIRIGHD
jgi:hypothetical protein